MICKVDLQNGVHTPVNFSAGRIKVCIICSVSFSIIGVVRHGVQLLIFTHVKFELLITVVITGSSFGIHRHAVC